MGWIAVRNKPLRIPRLQLRVVAVLTVLMLLLAACGKSADPGTTPQADPPTGSQGEPQASGPRYGGTVIVGLADDPPEMDPHFASANASRTILHNIFSTLVEVDDRLQIVPGLAHKWDVSEDGMVYTFYLEENVVFHDGTPFNAEAAKYNFDRMMDPDLGSARASELAFVDKVVVVDEFTLRVEMKRPYAALLPALASWAGMMVSPTAAEEYGRDFSQKLIGTGPFRFVEQIRDDRVVLERFEDYWREGLPYVDQIIYRPFPDVDARVLNLESGALHIIGTVPGKSVEHLSNHRDITFSSIGGLGFRGFMVNTSSGDLVNPLRRQALSACIDRELIVNTVFPGAATPSVQSPFSSATWVVDFDDPVPQRDLDEARRLLAEAGDPDGFEFTLLVTPDEESIRVASMVASMCREVGIEINIQQQEFGTILGQMGEGNYTAGQIELSPRNDPDLSSHPLFHSTGGINLSHYSSAEMDAVLDEARGEVDLNKRRELYRQANEIFRRDVPYVFIYHLNEMKAYRNELKGFPHIPDGMMRFEQVYLDE